MKTQEADRETVCMCEFNNPLTDSNHPTLQTIGCHNIEVTSIGESLTITY